MIDVGKAQLTELKRKEAKMLRGKMVAQILILGRKKKITIANAYHIPDTVLETVCTY